MQSGELDKRISILRDATTRGGSGGKKAWTTPETVCGIWAKMVTPTTPIRESSGQPAFPVSVQRVEWHVRYREDIRPDMRVKWERPTLTRTFEIKGIKAMSAREQFMVIETEEII